VKTVPVQLEEKKETPVDSQEIVICDGDLVDALSNSQQNSELDLDKTLQNLDLENILFSPEDSSGGEITKFRNANLNSKEKITVSENQDNTKNNFLSTEKKRKRSSGQF
jgi:hypothetical protein